MTNTIYALFDDDGLPKGFYPTVFFPDTAAGLRNAGIPAAAIEITNAQWDEFLANQGRRKWSGGQVVEYEPPAAQPTITDVNRERDRHFGIGAPIDLGDGRTFVADIDERSIINITALAINATRAQAAGDTATIDFRDHSNAIQTLSPADVIAMAEQAMARVTAVYAASWTIKALDPIPADYAADSRWPMN